MLWEGLHIFPKSYLEFIFLVCLLMLGGPISYSFDPCFGLQLVLFSLVTATLFHSQLNLAAWLCFWGSMKPFQSKRNSCSGSIAPTMNWLCLSSLSSPPNQIDCSFWFHCSSEECRFEPKKWCCGHWVRCGLTMEHCQELTDWVAAKGPCLSGSSPSQAKTLNSPELVIPCRFPPYSNWDSRRSWHLSPAIGKLGNAWLCSRASRILTPALKHCQCCLNAK